MVVGGLQVGAGTGVGTDVGTGVGTGVGSWVGTSVGIVVGLGQISTSFVVQFKAEALHAVAPQHEYGVPTSQAVHAEASLRSAGAEHPPQFRDPVPAYFDAPGQRL